MGDDKRSLISLLAVKTVCCGGLLLAVSGVGLGSIVAVLNNGWVQGGGAALILVGMVRYISIRRETRRRIEKSATPVQNVAAE